MREFNLDKALKGQKLKTRAGDRAEIVFYSGLADDLIVVKVHHPADNGFNAETFKNYLYTKEGKAHCEVTGTKCSSENLDLTPSDEPIGYVNLYLVNDVLKTGELIHVSENAAQTSIRSSNPNQKHLDIVPIYWP